MEKLMKIVEMLEALMDMKFTGHIKIHFDSGNVGSVEKFEEILKK